jgi:acetyl-CoA C-acetyltransferase
VTLEGRKGQGPTVVSQDEECYKFDPEKLRKLRPVFKENGTITAGNSSSISDGAAVLLLTSAAYAEQQDLPIMARICGFGDAAQSPEKYPTSPALAIPQALKHAGLSKNDISLFEINEAFSASFLNPFSLYYSVSLLFPLHA